MSTPTPILFTALLALAGCATSRAAAPESAPPAEKAELAPASDELRGLVQRTYDSFAQAVRMRDVDAVMRHLAADVEWRRKSGDVQHHDEVHALMRDYVHTRSEGPYYFELVSVHSDGQQVVAEVVLHDGLNHDRWTDTWSFENGMLKNRLGIEHK